MWGHNILQIHHVRYCKTTAKVTKAECEEVDVVWERKRKGKDSFESGYSHKSLLTKIDKNKIWHEVCAGKNYW